MKFRLELFDESHEIIFKLNPDFEKSTILIDGQLFVLSKLEGFKSLSVEKINNELFLKIDEFSSKFIFTELLSSTTYTDKTLKNESTFNQEFFVDNKILAPIPGKIIDIRVKTGHIVKEGELLFVLEAMKMENEIFAPKSGTLKSVLITMGESVTEKQVLMEYNEN